MSIAYQSWEIGSGPTVGYKLQAHQAGGDGFSFRRIYRPSPHHQQQQQQQETTAPTSPAAGRSPAKLPANLVNTNSPTSTSRLRSEDSTRFIAPQTYGFISGSSNTSSSGSEATASTASLQEDVNMPCSSSSSSVVTSSISAESSEDDEKEVESAFKGPLEQMDSLMTTLPIRRGISKFYVGKSRSFTSLADVKSMSMKDLAKPDNQYSSKRRRLPSHREDKARFPPPRVSTGISKKPIASSGTTLTLAVAMSSKAQGGDGAEERCASRWQTSCRSFSLTDLQKA